MTGDLFIGDVGQSNWEEVDFQPADSLGGENYGWRLMEGNHCFNPSTNCDDGTLTLPVLEYNHSLGCSITGGYRYRGAKILRLYGTYLYADFCSGIIWGATKNSNNWTTTQLLDTPYSINTFGEDEDGEIYIAHYSSNGAIYRIINASGGNLILSDLTPGIAGINNAITVTGAPPGSTVALLFSLQPGTQVISGGPCNGEILDLGNPVKQAGMVMANASGIAKFSGKISPSARGLTIYFQAAAFTSNPSSCEISNLITEVIQ
jgi:hypothetical protein